MKHGNRIFMWGLSFLCAFGLWVYITVVIDPIRDFPFDNIAVDFIGEEQYITEKNLVILNDKDTAVNLVFSGHTVDMVRLRNEGGPKATVDLSRVRAPGNVDLQIDISDIGDKTVVRRKDPASLTLSVDTLTEREIPLRFNLGKKTAAATGYKLAEAVFRENSILVKGPSSYLDRIDFADVSYENEQPLTKTIEGMMAIKLTSADPLTTAELARLDYPSETPVVLPVSKIKTIPLEIVLNEGGGLTRANIRCVLRPYENGKAGDMPPISSLQVSGDPALLDSLTGITLDTVDLASFVESTETKLYAVVLPDGVQNESGVDEVEATLSVVGDVATRSVTLSEKQITVEAVPPEGFVLNLITKRLKVRVRGPAESVAGIRPEQFRVVAHFEETILKEGVYSAAALVTLADNTCGIITDAGKSAEVTVEIVPAPAES